MKDFSVQMYTFLPLVKEFGLMPMLEKLPPMGYSGVEFCFFGGFNLDMAAIRDSATYATDFVLEQHDNFPVSIMDSLERNAAFLKAL